MEVAVNVGNGFAHANNTDVVIVEWSRARRSGRESSSRPAGAPGGHCVLSVAPLQPEMRVSQMIKKTRDLQDNKQRCDSSLRSPSAGGEDIRAAGKSPGFASRFLMTGKKK